MRYSKMSVTFSFLATFAIISSAQAQDIAPAPPAADALSEAPSEELAAPEALPLPLPAGEGCALTAPTCDSTAACCDYDPGATCCDPCAYRCCCCGHENCYMPGIHYRKKNGKLKWCRVWTTGDMYQHYAYYPAHHGYYYFRPYNYTNVLEHKEVVVRLGGERNHPYSVAMFDPVYDTYYLTSPKIVEEAPTMDQIPGASLLPNIEELLSE